MNLAENLFEKVKIEYVETMQELKNCKDTNEIKELEAKEKIINNMTKALTKYIQYNSMMKIKKENSNKK